MIPTGRVVFWIQLLWQPSAPLTSGFLFCSEEKDEKEKYFHNSDFSSATGSKAPANNDLNQHHANMFHSPKVTQTSGPTVLFFKVCHWAASVYGYFLNPSLITLTAKRSFYHPWCVRIKIPEPWIIVKLVLDVASCSVTILWPGHSLAICEYFLIKWRKN